MHLEIISFRAELVEQMSVKMGAEHHGEERQETDERKAERILAGELERRGWRESELVLRSKGDRIKIAIARRLRKETTMSLKWIAARLRMGSCSYVFSLVAAGESQK
jgi:hypothetical protein